MSATAAQIVANRENAAHSTGPKTEAGKTASSRNAVSLGLFTARDYVLPEEQEQYDYLCQSLWQELMPLTAMEELHALEIVRAAWSLQRCARIEGDLADRALASGHPDPLQNEADLRTQNAVDRARASANNTIRRATAELRRVQTNKELANVLLDDPSLNGLADRRQVTDALHAEEGLRASIRKANNLHSFEALLNNVDRQTLHDLERRSHTPEHARQNEPAGDQQSPAARHKAAA